MQLHDVPVKVGLALGSGAARGIAHVGVLEVLEEAGIPVHMISGCSMGSVVGAMYAMGKSTQEMRAMVDEIARDGGRSLMDFTFPRWGLIQGRKVENFLRSKLGEATFDDTKIPFAVAACCLEEGEMVYFREGSLVKAARASSSVPGIFEPVRMHDRTYVDGGVLDRVPVNILRDMGADVIIAVDVGYRGGGHGSPNNIYEVLMEFYSLMEWKAMERSMVEVDCMMAPPVQEISMVAFDQGREILRRGRLEAVSHLDEMKQMLAVMGVRTGEGLGGLGWMQKEEDTE